jgi:hypothetical protein
MCVVIMSAAFVYCVYSGHDLGCPIFGCVDRHQLPSFSLHLPVALGCVLALVLLAVQCTVRRLREKVVVCALKSFVFLQWFCVLCDGLV